MADGRQLVSDYLEALIEGDLERAGELLSEDFTFRGPMLETHGRDAYLDEAAGAFESVRGVRLLRQWEDADDVCSVYELEVKTPAAETTMLMSEWNQVRDGRLASSVLVFDTSVHDELMPEGHEH